MNPSPIPLAKLRITLFPAVLVSLVTACLFLLPPVAHGADSYIVGTGDVFRIRLHGVEGSLQEGVVVAADGTVSYLEARRVPVAGLSISDARAALEKALAESVISPRLIMSPVGLGSKSYTVLGTAVGSGSFPLTERVTLLDAIALSGGLDDRAVDFERSFLSRGGTKVPIDLKKLYSGGDLSQNLTLRNGDYLYIASVARHECYVFGAVRGPGIVPTGSQMTVMGAIASSGGYDRKAWQRKVLIVRGSMADPELIIVNSADIISAKATDVFLEPGDIVYVHTKPWALANELVDIALRAFITSSITRALDVGTSVGL